MSYISNTADQSQAMLAACGLSTMEDLFQDIPKRLKPRSFNLPEAMSELEVHSRLKRMAGRNAADLTCFIGGGYYEHFIPAAVDAATMRSEFYTAYTPYQPEISQGTLQAIYEYQSQICRLTGMEVSNASLYDGGTALYEACQMALNTTGREQIIVDGGVNPIYCKILESYMANHAEVKLTKIPAAPGQAQRDRIKAVLCDETAVLVLQNPNFFGTVDDHSDLVEECHKRGVLVIQLVYPIAMALLKTPGEMGVDIAIGEGQSLGIPLSFGGPYLGFLATTKNLVRKMPGRLVGRTVDRNDKECFVLTLQAREQHIRRDKAISNICTNQALCALRAHVYMSLMGREGLRELAGICHARAEFAKARFKQIPGVQVAESAPTFNEFTLRLPKKADAVVGELVGRGIVPGLPLGRFYSEMENCLLVAVTEMRTKAEICKLAENLESVL
ncbi:MAG: aminomethyl-transferring glycine dehydrogenase subunit GcvPA [Kiritimatiellae bacterium]|nr:aminomethyl-transferring glycine dehydrogenase subunit GcvPA [Kiritimatiellia bacterium]